MTLRDVEQLTSVPAIEILSRLNLMADIPFDQRLIQLQRIHGYEMNDVRKIIEEHISEM